MKETNMATLDYGSIDEGIAAKLQETGKFVRAGNRRLIEDIIAMGGRLQELKDALDRDAFNAWVDAECKIGRYAALQYMRAAAAFSDTTETISYLPPGIVFRLASAGEDIRANVLPRIELESPTPSDVGHMLHKARFEAFIKKIEDKKARLAQKSAAAIEKQRRAKKLRELRKLENEMEKRDLALNEMAQDLCGKYQDQKQLEKILKAAGEHQLAKAVRKAKHKPRQAYPKLKLVSRQDHPIS